MVYTVTLKSFVHTSYGVAMDYFNIGNVDADDLDETLETAARRGWNDANVRVSLHKDYLDSLAAEVI